MQGRNADGAGQREGVPGLVREWLNDEFRAEVESIYTSMAESEVNSFEDSQEEDLRDLVWLTLEFFYYLKSADLALLARDPTDCYSDARKELRYSCESVFAGMDSFASVCAAYRCQPGESRSELPGSVKSIEALKEQFLSSYGAFAAETDFARRCRLLLDLFKLQIIFAGLLYD